LGVCNEEEEEEDTKRNSEEFGVNFNVTVGRAQVFVWQREGVRELPLFLRRWVKQAEGLDDVVELLLIPGVFSGFWV